MDWAAETEERIGRIKADFSGSEYANLERKGEREGVSSEESPGVPLYPHSTAFRISG